MTPEQVLAIEEHSLRAWPAEETGDIRGWIVRASRGYTRRANSVNPIRPLSGVGADEAISSAEAWYAERGLPTIFKITPAWRPPALDAELERRGYAREAETSVMTLDLRPIEGREPCPVSGASSATEAWCAAFERFNSVQPRFAAPMRAILHAIQPPAVFLSGCRRGELAALGIGVADGGLIGLYDIVVAPEHRRQGCGTAIVAAILAWGREAGARTAYLQVMRNNAPALALYQGLGFAHAYDYWYRIKP